MRVAAHPGERVVAGGYDDGTVLIGAIEKESAVIARPGTGAAVSALSWSADGRELVVGTEAGEVARCRLREPLT